METRSRMKKTDFDRLFSTDIDFNVISHRPQLPSSHISLMTDMVVVSVSQTIAPNNLFDIIDQATSPSFIWIESASVIQTKCTHGLMMHRLFKYSCFLQL